MLTVNPSTRPSTRTTRADALVLRVEHWTPKGDYAERGDKERYRNEWDQIKKLPRQRKIGPKKSSKQRYYTIISISQTI